MRLRAWSASFLLAFTPPGTAAGIEIIQPKADSVLQGGGRIAIEWQYPGNFSLFSEATQYHLFLCAGGNHQDGYDQLAQVVSGGLLSDGNVALGNVDASVGESRERAYFLKMICSDPEGPTEITYSKRFTLTDMTGHFSQRVQDSLLSICGTDGPGAPTEKYLTKRQNPAMYTMPYEMQTGLTRYAPMAILPPTKITMKTPTPLHPPSAYTVATTVLAPPTVQITMTAPHTWAAAIMENTAAPAPQPIPQPEEDMEKFLKRWSD
ncbi:hypothetical protein FQN54_000929 [Arachnomyces sp. PD_36]|nr:hypothetical protein FQN54_000929 [Arachnomyces sp. PD_36]